MSLKSDWLIGMLFQDHVTLSATFPVDFENIVINDQCNGNLCTIQFSYTQLLGVSFAVCAVVTGAVCKPVFPPPLFTLLLTPGCHGELCWSLVLRAIALSAEDWMVFTELQSSHCTSQWCFNQTDTGSHFYTKGILMQSNAENSNMLNRRLSGELFAIWFKYISWRHRCQGKLNTNRPWFIAQFVCKCEQNEYSWEFIVLAKTRSQVWKFKCSCFYFIQTFYT